MKFQFRNGPTVESEGHPVRLVLDNGAEFILRPAEFSTHANERLEILLVPGTGPRGESDLATRPLASNRISVEAVGW